MGRTSAALLAWCRIVAHVMCLPLLWLMQGAVWLIRVLLFSIPRGRLAELTDTRGCVLRCRIKLRLKRRLTSASSPDDFLLVTQPELAPLDLLLGRHVSLYCLTPDMVLFVRTPRGTNIYSSETSPFFYQAQFLHAQEVYVTTHGWLAALEALGTGSSVLRTVPVAWLWSTGRCGSTMVSQVMEGVPGWVCLSEPDAVLNIAMMTKSERKTADDYQSLLKSVIGTLVYHAKQHKEDAECVFIKTRSECSILIRNAHRAYPDSCRPMYHVFMFRRLPPLLRSVKQLLSGLQMPLLTLVNSDKLTAITWYFRYRVFDWVFYGTQEEREALWDLVPGLSYVGIMATTICSQMKMVQKLQGEGLSIPALLYEDILADPDTTVGSLFDHFHISRGHLHEAVQSMARTSQRSVPGFDSSTAPRAFLSADERRQADRILARLQLPNIDEDVEFIQRIGHVDVSNSRNTGRASLSQQVAELIKQ